jgi:hypothetical protein
MSPFMKSRAVVVALTVVAGMGLIGPAIAGPRTFQDCKGMNAVYANGIAKTAKTAAHPVPGWIKIKPPLVDANTYAANRKLDRDNDGIACEVSS